MGRRCGTRCALVALRSDSRSESVHEAWACCAAHARPTPCASRHGQRGMEAHSGHRCARPRRSLRGRARALDSAQALEQPVPTPSNPTYKRLLSARGRAQRWPVRFALPSGCAEERSGRGARLQRSMQPLRALTRWRCLSGAAWPRSEFDSAPRTRAPQVARSAAEGRSQWGRLFFAYFLLAEQKKVGRPPGRIPGRQRPQPHFRRKALKRIAARPYPWRAKRQ